MHFTVIIEEPDREGWIVAKVPALPGCFSQGRSEDEALANIREAISSHLLALNARAQRDAAKRSRHTVEVLV
jgi:predicted RNase H-like HicB family nuclease